MNARSTDRLALVIDHESCWGCKACEVACKQEHHGPDGIKLIHVAEDGPRLAEGKPHFVYRVNTCRHCDIPECVEACPEEAIVKREEGIVILNEKECTGCGLCVDACPYHAIVFDTKQGTARKCNLCYHRVDRGLLPACADNVCLGHCIYFGQLEEIEKRMAKKRHRLWERRQRDFQIEGIPGPTG